MMKVYDLIAESWHKFRQKPLDFVVEFINNIKGSLLDAGCGTGRHLKYALSQGLFAVGFDSSYQMVKLCGGNSLVADIRHIPFKSKSFDYGICIAVLHHLKPSNLDGALLELKRVVKKDLLVSVWRHDQKKFANTSKETYIKWGNYKRYYYLYDPEEFKEKVSKYFTYKDISNSSNIILILRARGDLNPRPTA